jgi:hypothetical protein
MQSTASLLKALMMLQATSADRRLQAVPRVAAYAAIGRYVVYRRGAASRRLLRQRCGRTIRQLSSARLSSGLCQ